MASFEGDLSEILDYCKRSGEGQLGHSFGTEKWRSGRLEEAYIRKVKLTRSGLGRREYRRSERG